MWERAMGMDRHARWQCARHHRHQAACVVRIICFVAAGAPCSVPLLAQPKPVATGAPTAPSVPAPADSSDFLYRLGFKFNAATTCANGTCHGGADRQRDKEHGWLVRDNSYTLWNRDPAADQPGDPHRTSWRRLKAEPARQIGLKMGIDNASTDSRCQSCHALGPPANLLPGGNPIVSEGVTCDACHGPSGESVTLPRSDPAQPGRLALHLQHGWVAAQRSAFHDKPGELLKKSGFYDNHNLVARARRCTSCHLAIDGRVVAAGHPQPTFELSWFTLTYESRHWEDPAEDFFAARLWSAGQSAAVGDALRQLASRAADPSAAGEAGSAALRGAYEQAAAHAAVFRPLFTTGDAGGRFDAVDRSMTAMRPLLSDPSRRGELADAARSAASAADALAPVVEGFKPGKASTQKLLAAILSQAPPDDTAGFGIEQHRDAILALFEAWAAGNGVAKVKADEDRKQIGEKLFPSDAAGRLIPAKELDAARYKAAVAEVKAKLGL